VDTLKLEKFVATYQTTRYHNREDHNYKYKENIYKHSSLYILRKCGFIFQQSAESSDCFVRIIFIIPINTWGKQNTFPDYNLEMILKHIYIPDALKLFYQNGGVFNCDYCHFYSDFRFQQVGNTVACTSTCFYQLFCYWSVYSICIWL
jgi:hypothetical protein